MSSTFIMLANCHVMLFPLLQKKHAAKSFGVMILLISKEHGDTAKAQQRKGYEAN